MHELYGLIRRCRRLFDVLIGVLEAIQRETNLLMLSISTLLLNANPGLAGLFSEEALYGKFSCHVPAFNSHSPPRPVDT